MRSSSFARGKCPYCKNPYRCRSDSDGLIRRCEACGQKFRVDLHHRPAGCLGPFLGLFVLATLCVVIVGVVGVFDANRGVPPGQGGPIDGGAAPGMPTKPGAVRSAVPPVDAEAAYRKATALAMQKLAATPEYIAAKKKMDDADAYRKTLEPIDRLPASHDFVAAKQAFDDLVRARIESDPGVQAAKKQMQ
jgi:uncharacterized iron-regulated membrane protein